MYEENKTEWARKDAQTARYAYRVQYNVPRVPHERIDELTEYEFNYELILRNEYHIYQQSLIPIDPIKISQGLTERSIVMDPELYDDIRRRAEAGEYVSFQLPDDSDAPRLSDRMRPAAEEVPVDPGAVFGGD